MLTLFWLSLLLPIQARNFNLDDYNTILTPASMLHGPVKKEGMLPVECWSVDDFKSGPKLKFIDWYNDPKVKNSVPPLSSSCRVWVNSKYKLAFIRNKKAASTTIIEGFNNECDTGSGHHKKKSTKPFWTEMKHKEYLGKIKPEEFWSSYTVFVVSRNPWARAFSGFKHILTRNATRHELLHDLLSHKGFEAFTKDPFVVARRCEETPECKNSRWPDYYRRHVEPFARCVKNKDGGLAVDYVLRYENLEEDWKDFQKFLNKRPKVPKIKKTLRHCKEASLHLPADEFYMKCGFDCVKRMTKYYKEDIDAFGFSLPKSMALELEETQR